MFVAIISMIVALTSPRPFGSSPNFAPTPERAVLNIVGGTVVRTNVAGRYATVFVRNGSLEGSPPEKMVILVEHFRFGWQPLEDLYFSCRLNEHVVGAYARTMLLRGMLKGNDDKAACGQGTIKYDGDFGPRVDIEAVRRQEHGPLVPRVLVVENYALGGWYGAGGGPHLFQKIAGRWRGIAGTGGAADEWWLQRHSVPRRLWCRLLSVDATCPR